MSRYRKIEVRTWSDSKFRSLSPIQPSGQALWFFLLTGPHTGPIPGLFRAGRAAMAEELGWSQEDFDEAFREVSDKDMAKADFKAKLVWLPNAIKHNKPESPNVIKSWRVELDLLPECALKKEALASIGEFMKSSGSSYEAAYFEAIKKAPEKKHKAKSKDLPKDLTEDYVESGTGAGAGTGTGHSVPSGTADKSAEELAKKELWDAGKSILEEQGMPAKQCGSFVGKLVKDYGDMVVMDAVRAAVVNQPADAAGYIKASCQHAAGQRKRPGKQEALEKHNQEIADAWANQGEEIDA